MTPERQALLDSLERHALTYWAKREAAKRWAKTERDKESNAWSVFIVATDRLQSAAKALGDYDATIHPV